MGGEDDPAKTARYFLDRGDYVQAVQYFEASLAKNPDQKGLRVFCAFSYFKQNQFDRAEENPKREVGLFPDCRNALVLLAAVYYRQGRGAEAESVCRDFLGTLDKRRADRDTSERQGDPAGVPLQDANVGLPNFILGLLDKQQGRFEQAVGNFGKATELGCEPLACHLHILDAAACRQAWERVMALALELRRAVAA